MLSAVCYLYASSPGLGLTLVVLVAMVFGALPFAFSRSNALMVAADADGFMAHLGELRWRLLRILRWTLTTFFFLPLALGVFSLWCDGELGLWTAWRSFFEGAGDIYGFLVMPLLDNLPKTGALIAIGMVSPILVPMKAAFFFALCAMMPFILSESWKFVAPGLYNGEKGIAIRLVATSAALFYVGIVFAYFIVFHVVFGVIAAVTPDTVNWTPDIGELFGGMLLMFFSFGLVFELPVAMLILVRAGAVQLEKLKVVRPFVIVGAFVVAAIVTPPDIWSQIIFALLCWLLYESGLIAINPKAWWKDVKGFVLKKMRSMWNLLKFSRDLPKFLVYLFRSRKKNGGGG